MVGVLVGSVGIKRDYDLRLQAANGVHEERTNLIGLGVVYAFGFTAYSRTMAALEQFLVAYPAAALLFLAAIACACILPSRWDEASSEPLDYEGNGDPVVRTLGVASR